MLNIKDVELIEQAVLAIIHKMDHMLQNEPLEKVDYQLFKDNNTEFFSQIQSTLQQEWIHLGRLKKRIQDNG